MRRRKENSEVWRDSALETGGFADFSFDSRSNKGISLWWCVAVSLCFVLGFVIARQNLMKRKLDNSIHTFRKFEEDEICKLIRDYDTTPYVLFRDGKYLIQPKLIYCGDGTLTVDEICETGKVVTSTRCATVQVEHLQNIGYFSMLKKSSTILRDTKAICVQHWLDVMHNNICL